MPRYIDEATRFLNVDFDICSRSNLEPLVAALGKRVHVLYSGRHGRTYEARLELASYPKSASAAIQKFAALIGGLPEAQRDLWYTAKRRDFSIGVGVATQPLSYDLPLTREAVEAACGLKARIVLTIYAPEVKAAKVRRKRSGQRSVTN